MVRDPGVDAARSLATLGVVLLHAALPYLATPIGWAVQDPEGSHAMDLLVWTARQFLMPTFFLLAGWLGARSLARGGARAMLGQRAWRLGLPLVVLVVPMSLAMNAMWRWGRELVGRDAVAAPVPALRASELPVTLGHLWYLYYLLLCTAVALVASLAWRRAPARWRAAAAGAVRRVEAAGLAAPVMAVPTVATLALAGKLQVDTPLGFVPDPVIAAYFGGFFAWGWWLGAATASAGNARPRRAALALVLAVALVAALVPALLASVDGARPGPLALAGAALSSWLLVTGLVDACRAWRRPPAWIGRLAVASYWVYLVHLPVVVLLQLAASRVAAPAAVELVVIAAVALAVSLATFALVRRTPVARVVI